MPRTSHSRLIFCALIAAVLSLQSAQADPLGTAFTYQGHLKDGRSPANGNFNMIFKLFDAAAAGNQIGPTLTFDGVSGNPAAVIVTNGLFSVPLDFGGSAYGGDKRWLEVLVNGSMLSSRQELTPAPFSQRAVAAMTSGSVPWSGITDVPANVNNAFSPWMAQLPIIGWGSNSSGQVNIQSGSFTAITGGNTHSLAIRIDGSILGWGSNTNGQINVPSGKFSTVAAGALHSLAIRGDGTLVGWGNNSFGQSNVPSGTFLAVSSGTFFNVAIRSDGTLAAWGDNGNGQTNVPSGAFIAIAAGSYHALAIRSDGTLAGWGSNVNGETNVPPGTFVAVAAGETHSLAIRTDGTLVGWGDNSMAQISVPPGSFVAVAAKGNHSLAIRSDGALLTWSYNGAGLNFPPLGTFISIAAGYEHNLAISAAIGYDSGVALGGRVSIADRLGVGTTWPGARLHVAVSGNDGIIVSGDGGGDARILISNNGGNHFIFDDADGNHDLKFESAPSRALAFNTNGAAERMRITSSGNVGIGTSVPSQKLHVIGNICATGTIGACSDARFKTHVVPLDNALSLIDRLRPVRFDWKRDEFCDREFAEGRQIGFIAQEVEEVLPQVVSTGSDGYLSMDYGRLTPILVEAVKEMKRERDTESAGQQRAIRELRTQNAELRTRLEHLEALMSASSKTTEGAR
jgi:hypothetical protein